MYDIGSTTVKNENSKWLLGSSEPGAQLALREPRLLMYDIKNSLVPKVRTSKNVGQLQFIRSSENGQINVFHNAYKLSISYSVSPYI